MHEERGDQAVGYQEHRAKTVPRPRGSNGTKCLRSDHGGRHADRCQLENGDGLIAGPAQISEQPETEHDERDRSIDENVLEIVIGFELQNRSADAGIPPNLQHHLVTDVMTREHELNVIRCRYRNSVDGEHR